jgi:hypothetical protein
MNSFTYGAANPNAVAPTDPLAINYQGGATGVTNDYDLRQLFAQMAGQSLNQGMNLPSATQIQTAKGDLTGALSGYQNLMTNGMFTPDEMAAITSNNVQQVNNTTQAMQQNLNAANQARGVHGNAGQSAALDMAGQFQAAGARGKAASDIATQQANSRVTGLNGYAGLSGTMAGLDTQAVKQDPNSSQYMDLYNKFRNATIGPDGANFASAGTAGTASGGPVASAPTTSLSFNPTPKKNNSFNYAY